MLAAAVDLNALRQPPGNHLETLKDDRNGQHSIRVNKQWRLCFVGRDGGADDVEFVDYHWGEANMIGPHPPVHPGEILREEFLIPLGLTAYAVAKSCKVPRTRIERLAREEVPVTADTALRLGRYFSTGPEFWMNLQVMFDLVSGSAATDLNDIEPRAA
jgi:addiction module HigA family antidote